MLLVFGENFLLFTERHFFPSNIRSNSHIGPGYMENEIKELLLLSILLNRKEWDNRIEWDKGVKLFCPILYTTSVWERKMILPKMILPLK